MAGLVKAKDFDWKDSNMAMIGTDEDRSVKKAAAETEPAWKGAGQKVGMQIWRIVKFKVKHWPKEDYGKFYQGDSYILMNTYKKPDCFALEYDLHFWIGKESTQDEYGTAAYKTVELDTLLDDKPIQHREVQSYESDLFNSYFNEITIMMGGADTGFRHVEPKNYRTRLLHFHGDRKRVTVKEVPAKKAALDSSDVFILDKGLVLFQWNGKTCNKDEKFKAVQYLQSIKSERGKAKVETLDEIDVAKSHEFYASLSDETLEEGDLDELKVKESKQFAPQLFKLSDATGQMEFSLVAEGKLARDMLDPNDVFILDNGKDCYAWIGRGTTDAEKSNAMPYAHNYLMKSDHPLIPVSCMKQGKETPGFFKNF